MEKNEKERNERWLFILTEKVTVPEICCLGWTALSPYLLYQGVSRNIWCLQRCHWNLHKPMKILQITILLMMPLMLIILVISAIVVIVATINLMQGVIKNNIPLTTMCSDTVKITNLPMAPTKQIPKRVANSMSMSLSSFLSNVLLLEGTFIEFIITYNVFQICVKQSPSTIT